MKQDHLADNMILSEINGGPILPLLGDDRVGARSPDAADLAIGRPL
jgi:hypothetical protein